MPNHHNEASQKHEPIEVKATPTSSLKRVTLLALIVATAALLSSLYVVMSNHHFRQAIIQLSQQKSTQERLAHLTVSHTQLTEQVDQFKNKLSIILAETQANKDNWLLMKAQHYLELAQINAHWSDDQESTIALLALADSLLKRIHDQQLFPIRQAIAEEMTQLKTLPKIDKIGLLSQLDAAKSMITTLPLKTLSNPLANSPEIPVSSQSSWKEQWQKTMKTLQKLIIIRHHEQDTGPLLSPLHEDILKESIELILNEAQWAVLQNNAAIYELTLAQAIKKIETNFNPNEPSTQALILQLKKLQQKKLTPPKPILGKALPLLNQAVDNKQATPPPSLPNKEGGSQE